VGRAGAASTAGPYAGPSLPAGLRLLSPQDFEALRTLHHRIVDLAPPGTVARETDRFLTDRLGPRGQTLGLFADGKMMIAYAIVGLPQDAEEALIQPEEVDPPPAAAIAVLDGVGVLPAWRGGGLQRMLCEVRCELALAHGRQILRATATPANPWSWCNLLRADLVVTALLRM
jgi:hypothetical protein